MYLRNKIAAVLSAILLCTCLGIVCNAAPQAQAGKPDAVCQQLYDDYVVRVGKFTPGLTTAVAELINDRGRATGFWKTVLQGLEGTKDEWEASRYVRVLARMLRDDGDGRWIAKLPYKSDMQWSPGIYLPQEVLLKLIERGSAAIGPLADWCVIALAGANDPVAHDFLAKAMATTEARNISARFHAAVGLVNLGDKSGVEWLIARCEDKEGDVASAWPRQAGGRQLSANCIAVLRDISSHREFKTKSEFQDWWTANRDKWTAGRPADLVEAY